MEELFRIRITTTILSTSSEVIYCSTTNTGKEILGKVSNCIISPNPTNGKFSKELSHEYSEVDVIISNIFGQEVSKRKFKNSLNLIPAFLYFRLYTVIFEFRLSKFEYRITNLD